MMTTVPPLPSLDRMTGLARQKNLERQAESFKPGQSREQLRQVAQEFEAMFMAEMLQPMFEGVGKSDGMFGGGHGEEIFKSLMVQEYGKIMAKRGGLGIAKQLEARYGAEVAPRPQTVSAEPLAEAATTADSVTKLSSKLPRF